MFAKVRRSKITITSSEVSTTGHGPVYCQRCYEELYLGDLTETRSDLSDEAETAIRQLLDRRILTQEEKRSL